MSTEPDQESNPDADYDDDFHLASDLRVVILLILVGLLFWATLPKTPERPSKIHDNWVVQAIDRYDNHIEVRASLEQAAFLPEEQFHWIEPVNSHTLIFQGKLRATVKNTASRPLFHIRPSMKMWLVYPSQSSICKIPPSSSENFVFHGATKGQSVCALGVPVYIDFPPQADMLEMVRNLDVGESREFVGEIYGVIRSPDMLGYSWSDQAEINSPHWSLIEVVGVYESKEIKNIFLNRVMSTYWTKTNMWRSVETEESCRTAFAGPNHPGHQGCPP